MWSNCHICLKLNLLVFFSLLVVNITHCMMQENITVFAVELSFLGTLFLAVLFYLITTLCTKGFWNKWKNIIILKYTPNKGTHKRKINRGWLLLIIPVPRLCWLGWWGCILYPCCPSVCWSETICLLLFGPSGLFDKHCLLSISCLNCLKQSRQFKWVPTIYDFMKNR